LRLSIVVPVLDEESVLGPTLAAARDGLRAGDELLVVDGGSTDGTGEIAREGGADCIEGPRGRGRQMNAGAARANGELLLFLHADTLLPAGFRSDLDRLMADATISWGRFDLEFDEGGPLLRLIAHLISWRSRAFRSATGDQAIFVRRPGSTVAGQGTNGNPRGPCRDVGSPLAPSRGLGDDVADVDAQEPLPCGSAGREAREIL
jgi:glycosyltransferase involved in cell wall biosynthesis